MTPAFRGGVSKAEGFDESSQSVRGRSAARTTSSGPVGPSRSAADMSEAMNDPGADVSPRGRGDDARCHFSVVVPAFNEAGSVRDTVEGIVETLERGIDYEVVVVDDASTDDTAHIVRSLVASNPRVRYHLSHNPRGFGLAVRAGLDVFRGDVVAIVMADGSDDPQDLCATSR